MIKEVEAKVIADATVSVHVLYVPSNVLMSDPSHAALIGSVNGIPISESLFIMH